MNLYDAITKRISIRKYTDKLVDGSLTEEIKREMKNIEPLSTNSYLRLEVITDPEVVKPLGLGSAAGIIKINAPHCIVGIIDTSEDALTNLGFVLQQLVIRLQARGISTCWLGTFSQDKVKEVCNLAKNEKPVITLAFGYAQEAFLNDGFRKLLNTSKRKELSEIAFFKEWGESIDTYLNDYSWMRSILYLSLRYPSTNNSQPVRVVIDEEKALIFAKRDKYDAYKIDAGIFMAHFFLACKEEGLEPEACLDPINISPYNNPNHYAYIGMIKYKR